MGIQVLWERGGGEAQRGTKTNGNVQREKLRLGPVKIVKKSFFLFFFFLFFFLAIAELKNWLSASEKSVAALHHLEKMSGALQMGVGGGGWGESLGANSFFFLWGERGGGGWGSIEQFMEDRKNSKNIKSRQPKN